jgi:glycerol uptake facilitator-like aquaporin
MHRAIFAEGLGSMLLAAAVIGSGIMAQRLTGDSAVALLTNTLATVAALAVLIAVLAPISGGHFNPAVSFVAYLRGQLSLRIAATYVVAQVVGCCLGAVLAHAMFELPLLQAATHARDGLGQFLSEMVATAALIAVVSVCTTPSQAAWRVPAWIGAAYWFTASTSFANPAITMARAVSDTFAGIRPMDVPAFIAAQVLGALVGFALSRWLFGSLSGSTSRAPSRGERVERQPTR